MVNSEDIRNIVWELNNKIRVSDEYKEAYETALETPTTTKQLPSIVWSFDDECIESLYLDELKTGLNYMLIIPDWQLEELRQARNKRLGRL